MSREHRCGEQQTYFDVPRMRSSNDYLTTGIAFAFHPHRDTWYCQCTGWTMGDYLRRQESPEGSTIPFVAAV